MEYKFLINVNKFATDNIAELEESIKNAVVNDEKSKANFGNCCVALRGFRMVADATEAILHNEGYYKGDNGKFYTEVKVEDVEPESTGPAKDADQNTKE